MLNVLTNLRINLYTYQCKNLTGTAFQRSIYLSPSSDSNRIPCKFDGTIASLHTQREIISSYATHISYCYLIYSIILINLTHWNSGSPSSSTKCLDTYPQNYYNLHRDTRLVSKQHARVFAKDCLNAPLSLCCIMPQFWFDHPRHYHIERFRRIPTIAI